MEGKVIVLSSSGDVISIITVAGPELSGVAISGNYLYITERSTATIYRVDI